MGTVVNRALPSGTLAEGTILPDKDFFPGIGFQHYIAIWKASDKKMQIVKVKKKIPQFSHRRTSSEFAHFSFSVIHTSNILYK